MSKNLICYAVDSDGRIVSDWRKIFLRKCVGMAAGTETMSMSRQVRTLPVVDVRAEWLELPGPTSLARILIAEGREDDEVLSATKTVFGSRTDGTPRLFTRTDLARLRARIAKKGEV
jgi:hypothetical protein